MFNWRRILLGLLIYTMAFLLFKLDAFATTPQATKKPRFSKIYAQFETNLGTFKALLFHTYAPKTVDNFVKLAEGEKEWMDPKSRTPVRTPFYDGLIFHRVIKNFVIQTGDPMGLDPKRAGAGGPGFNLEPEIHRDLRHDKAGILSMANAVQKDTKKNNETISGSQFFITLAPQKDLDGKFPIFGEVVEGLDVVEKIGNVKTDRRTDRPVEAVVIKKVTIIRK